MFGAATDYALLLVARYREELARREDRHEAMRAALGGAAPAIVASAMTVVLALLTLLLARVGGSEGARAAAAAGVLRWRWSSSPDRAAGDAADGRPPGVLATDPARYGATPPDPLGAGAGADSERAYSDGPAGVARRRGGAGRCSRSG